MPYPAVLPLVRAYGMYDLVFIGGGLSGSLSLIYLLKELGRFPARAGTDSAFSSLRLAMVDRDGNFGTGFPYGHLAHPMFLLNETVRTMDVCGFSDWLVLHRDRWLEMLQQNPHAAVRAWLQINWPALSQTWQDPADYHGLYLPRCVFGLFMHELLCESIERAQQASKVKVDLVAEEAVSLTRVADGSLRIGLKNDCVVPCRRVLLGLGSLPSQPAPHLKGVLGYVHNLYGQGPDSLRACCKSLSGRANPRRVAIIGSNAAAMEAIYSIQFDREVSSALDEVLVISPSGSLPDGKPSQRQPAFEARRTHRLAHNGTESSADNLFAALLHDAEEAKRDGYTSLDYSGAADDPFRLAFTRLSADEQRRFVECFGERFTTLNRHTPPEYVGAAESLKNSGKLRLVRGHVTAIERRGADLFVIADAANGEQLRMQAAVVINCRGSGALSQTSDPFLRNILKQSDIARINSAGAGIKVTADFEASPGVFVMGPLLAGHSSETDHIWNLESAPRNHGLAQHLVAVILKQILQEVCRSTGKTSGQD